jgi:hypothetical protein
MHTKIVINKVWWRLQVMKIIVVLMFSSFLVLIRNTQVCNLNTRRKKWMCQRRSEMLSHHPSKRTQQRQNNTLEQNGRSTGTAVCSKARLRAEAE